MWKWFRKKLGIKNYEDELINLNAKVYELIRLHSEILSEIHRNQIVIKELENKIKAIPKEIVVKNVLSI